MDCVAKIEKVLYTLNLHSKTNNKFAEFLNKTNPNKRAHNETIDETVDFNHTFKKIKKIKKFGYKNLFEDKKASRKKAATDEDYSGDEEDSYEDDESSDVSSDSDDSVQVTYEHNEFDRRMRNLLRNYHEAHDENFINRVQRVLHEFKNGSVDPPSLSGCKWDSSHRKGFVAYVMCRILSKEGPAYAPPTNRGNTEFIYEYTTGNPILDKEVQEFVRYRFGILPDSYNNEYKHYPASNFRRKCSGKEPKWFYLKVHEYIGITGFHLNPKPITAELIPDDFSWALVKQQKKDVKQEKKTDVKKEKK